LKKPLGDVNPIEPFDITCRLYVDCCDVDAFDAKKKNILIDQSKMSCLYLDIKETLHPFALSFVSLETQSYF